MVTRADVALGAALALDGTGRFGDRDAVPCRGDIPLQSCIPRLSSVHLLLDAVAHPGFGGGGDEQGDTEY